MHLYKDTPKVLYPLTFQCVEILSLKLFSYLVGHFSAKELLLLTAVAASQEKRHREDAIFPSKWGEGKLCDWVQQLSKSNANSRPIPSPSSLFLFLHNHSIISPDSGDPPVLLASTAHSLFRSPQNSNVFYKLMCKLVILHMELFSQRGKAFLCGCFIYVIILVSFITIIGGNYGLDLFPEPLPITQQWQYCCNLMS